MSQAISHNRVGRVLALLVGAALMLLGPGLAPAGAQGGVTISTPCGDLEMIGSQYSFDGRTYDNLIISDDATITGTPGDDFACGGPGDNTINGLGGNDALFGRTGNDTLVGGTGSDILKGGQGDDTLTGLAGADTLIGNGGDDAINGGSGPDTIDGDAGNDVLQGGQASDTIKGGPGSDTITGDGSADTINGGKDDDAINGGPQDDVIVGALGNDAINGNGGDDDMSGNGGDDTLKGQAGTDTARGMTGTDLCLAEIETGCENFAPVPKDPANDARMWLTEQIVGERSVGSLAKSIDGDTLSIVAVDDSGTTADVTFTATGFSVDPRASHDYLPNYPTVASEPIVVSVSDGIATTDVNVTLDIHGFDDAPTALDDDIETIEEKPVTDNLLDNDSDPDDGDSISLITVDEGGPATPVTGPTTFTFASGATADVDTDGSVTYTPAPDSNGLADGETQVDVLGYAISDADGDTDDAEATFTVNGVDDRPVAVDDEYTTDEDNAVSDNILDNDFDDDGETITVGSVNGSPLASPYTLASGAELTLAADGSFTYTPPASANSLAVGEELVDTIVYRITDGEGDFSVEATVTFTIEGTNDAPTAVFDDTDTDEDNPVTIDPAANDTDPDTSDDLFVSAVDATGTTGTVTLNLDGTVTYDPDGEFESLDTGDSELDDYGYTVSDGNGGTDTDTVAVLVAGVNDAPIAEDDDAETDEDDAVSFNVLDDNGYGADSDIDDGDTITVNAINGTPVAGETTITLFSGTKVTIDTDGSVTVVPAPIYNELAEGDEVEESFVYVITDGDADSNEATVTVLINGTNDGPDAVDDPDEVTDEDTSLIIDVLANDSDADDGDEISVVSVDTEETLGDVTINLDGTVTYDPRGAFDDLQVLEDDTDTFEYTIEDDEGAEDTAEVTVTVTGINDAPIVVDDMPSVTVGDTVVIPVLDDDIDPEGGPLTLDSVDFTGTAGLISVNAGAQTITYDPADAFDGLAEGETDTDVFTYTIEDDQGATGEGPVTVTVTGVNDDPVAQDQSFTTSSNTPVSITLDADDIDSDDDPSTLTYSWDDPSEGVVTDVASPDVEFSPDGSFDDLLVGESRDATFTWTATDSHGAVSNTGTVTITVEGINDPPFGDDASANTDEETPVDIGLTATDADDTAPFTWAITTAPAEGDASLVDETATFDPDGEMDDLAVGESRDVVFEATPTDDGGAVGFAGVITVTVDGVNDVPTADDGSADTDEDTSVLITLTGDDVDSDDDATTLTYEVVDGPEGGDLTEHGDGTVTFDPDGDFDDLDAGDTTDVTFTFNTTDQHDDVSDSATVTVTITGINDAPVAKNDLGDTDEDTGIAIDVLDNDFDPDDGDDISFETVPAASASGVPLTVNLDDTIQYDPAGVLDGLTEGELLEDTFSYTITDLAGAMSTAEVTIEVTGINDDPTAVDDDAATDEDTGISIELIDDDTDPDSPFLTLGSFDSTSDLGVPISPDEPEDEGEGPARIGPSTAVIYDPAGVLDYLPEGFVETDDFEYGVTDLEGGFDTGTVTVTVTGVNDAPEADDDSGDGFEASADPIVTPSVLDNDSDVDDFDSFSVTGIDTTGTTGTVGNNGDGTFTYTPAAPFTTGTTDSWDYTITDSFGATATATVTIEELDGDNDGVGLTLDCNDADPDTYPGAPETPYDAIDQNCDGNVLDDVDSDGFDADLAVGGTPDCDDGDDSIYPGATEIVDDGIDQDCDGTDLTTWYLDGDVDTYGDANVSTENEGQPIGYVADNTDCDDGDDSIYPGATEVPYDTIDQDCDGFDLDDVDDDGSPSDMAIGGTPDCNDGDDSIYPGATEIVDDGIDQDCDGFDEVTWFADGDTDTYGDAGNTTTAPTQPVGYVADNTDCDDLDPATYPGAPEIPPWDGIDQNCDGNPLDDFDGDGFDAEAPFFGTPDCNDLDPTINPGAPDDTVDGTDQNCDGIDGPPPGP